MNRINLLKPRASQSHTQSSALDVASPGFVLRGREIVIGLLLVGLAAGALYWQVSDRDDRETLAEGEPDDGVVVVDMPPQDAPESQEVAALSDPEPPAAEDEPYDPAAEPPLLGTAEVVAAPAADPVERPGVAQAETASDPPAAVDIAAQSVSGDVALGCETPCTITGLSAAATDDRVLITVASEGRPDAGAFRVDNPSRVVVDFPATNIELTNGGQSLSQDLGGALANNLRIAQNSLDPPKVRLVIEVAEFPDAQISPSPEGLSILLIRQQ